MFQPSKVVQDFASIHSVFHPGHSKCVKSTAQKSATSPHRVPGTMPPGGGNPVEVIVPLRECIITDSSSYAYLKYIASYNQKLDDIP